MAQKWSKEQREKFQETMRNKRRTSGASKRSAGGAGNSNPLVVTLAGTSASGRSQTAVGSLLQLLESIPAPLHVEYTDGAGMMVLIDKREAS